MSNINVKVRVGSVTIYSTTVFIGLDSDVMSLKNMVCRANDTLNKGSLISVYCGEVMEDEHTLRMYNLTTGDTVHMFTTIKQEKHEVNKPLSDNDIAKLSVAFRSLSMNSSYRAALLKLTKPAALYNLIMTNPNLNKDPIAITLLQHPELLAKLTNVEMVKRIASVHPALASAALQLSASVHEEVMQNHFASDIARSMLNGSDEDLDDLDDSSPASETSNSRPVSRNLSSGAITAAQLASAIASVTPLTSQPSTSSASTSSTPTVNTRNTLETPPNNVPSEQSRTGPLLGIPLQLHIMRDMGLVNDALNLEALQLSGNLETAIELVLNGFNVPSPDTNNG